MPSAKSFHHLELDGVGNGKRPVCPPSGKDSDIFGTRASSSFSTSGEKWIRNGGKSLGSSSPSSISISGSEASSPILGGPSPSTSPLPSRRRASRTDDTKARLFNASSNGTSNSGSSSGSSTPRKVRDRLTKSTVFSTSESELRTTSGLKSPHERNVRRPVVGRMSPRDTQNRLFGPAPESPRKVRDLFKSTVFEAGADSGTKNVTPVKQTPERNVLRRASKSEDTQNKLFGASVTTSPVKVRVTPTIKSTIFATNGKK